MGDGGKELDKVGGINTEALRAVVEDSEKHPGGYDPILVRVYKDGTGEISTSRGISAETSFKGFL